MNSPTRIMAAPSTASQYLQNKAVRVSRQYFESEKSLERYVTTQYVQGWDCSLFLLNTDQRGRDLYEITRIAR